MNIGGLPINSTLGEPRVSRFVAELTIVLSCLLLSTAAAQDGQELLVDSVLLAAITEVEVPAQEAGALVELLIAEGAMVEAGQRLASIDDAEVRLERDRAQIELDNARRNADNDIKIRVTRAAAEVAAAELRRALEAREQYPNSVSDAEVDHLRLAVDHAKLQVEQAEYDRQTAQLALRLQENAVERATLQMQRRQIRSPISGRVVQVFRQCGEWVEPGQPVARILRLDRLKAVGYLDARHADPGLTGRPVRLQVQLADDEPPLQFAGTIKFVHSEVNPVNEQLDFWAEIVNPDLRLRPGQKGSLMILPGNEMQ